MYDYTHLIIMAVVFFIVIPIFKGIWGFITKERLPKTSVEVPEEMRKVALSDWNNPDNVAVSWWKTNMTNPAAFLSVETPEQSVCTYSPLEIPDLLHEAILNGLHTPTSNSTAYGKGEDEKWQEKTQPFQKIIDQHFKLKLLYRPVWTYALLGLKWGVLLGIALKLLDTAIGLLSVEPGAGLCFLAAVGICFIPKVGMIGVIVLSIVLNQFYKANFFIMGITAAITGALLGCLPGMAVGGMIGFGKRNKIKLAPDAENEKASFIKIVVLPLLAGLVLIAFYIFIFNPWLLNYLSEQGL